MKKIIIITFIYVSIIIWFFPTKDKENIHVEDIKVLSEINVLIEGEVAYPGVYTFYESVMIGDVINYAGVTDNADLSNVNLLEVITADKKVVIDKKDSDDNPLLRPLININEASFEDLIKIPNITEKRAANIIIYREKNGLFKSLDELVNVKYIGSATFEKIKEYLTV